MTRLALLLLCLLFSGCGPCHSHFLGLVLDEQSGEPIERAEVRIAGVPQGPFFSDDEGYVVADAPCRTEPYEITISVMGYRQSVFEQVLREHEHERTVKLKPLN